MTTTKKPTVLSIVKEETLSLGNWELTAYGVKGCALQKMPNDAIAIAIKPMDKIFTTKEYLGKSVCRIFSEEQLDILTIAVNDPMTREMAKALDKLNGKPKSAKAKPTDNNNLLKRLEGL